MVQTVRRTPQRVRIPAGTNKQIHNILEFGGIHQSKNPFNVPENTASDIKNLYINEEGTLTTRLRLDNRGYFDFDEDLISFHNLKNNNKLLQFEDKCIFVEETELGFNDYETLVGAISTTEKIKVIEETDEVFLLTGENIYKIELSGTDLLLHPIEDYAYIPNRYTGTYRTEFGLEEEPLNLLTPSYNIKYLWDGSWDYTKIDNVTNYPKEFYNIDVKNNILSSHDNIKILAQTEKGFLFSYRFAYIFTRFIVYDYEEDSFTQIFEGEIDIPNDANSIDISSDLSTVGVISTDDEVYVYKLISGVYTLINEGNPVLDIGVGNSFYSYTGSSTLGKKIKLSETGEYLGLLIGNEADPFIFIYEYINSDTQDEYEVYNSIDCKDIGENNETGENFYVPYELLFVNREKTVVNFHSNDHYSIAPIVHINFYKPVEDMLINNFYYRSLTPTYITDDGLMSIALLENGVFINEGNNMYETISTGEVYSNEKILINKDKHIIITNIDRNELYYYNPKENFKIKLKISSELLDPGIFSVNIQDNKITLLTKDNIVYIDLIFNQTHHNLKLTYQLTDKDPEYEKWLELNNKIKGSLLKNRFDNELYLASDNYLFKSRGNTIKYFSINDYDRLGDNNEITGFNIISDNHMVVYKQDTSYLIQLIINEYNNQKFERKTEAKYSKGNIAKGEAITSSYSEIPLQITKEGILTIKQLEDLSSTERITINLTENIFDFIKEENIKDIISFNYKYWTLFYLNKRIYVLDNRNSGWYIWEVPINIKSFWIEEDILFCIDDDLKMYAMVNEDILNRENSKTEYYDKLNSDDNLNDKIIEWKWKSQILHMKSLDLLKRLTDTRFIVTDTDLIDDFGVDYKFHIYRNHRSETTSKTLQGEVQIIRTKNIRTHIPRFNYIQLELNNIPENYSKNKLNLLGLVIKYQYLGESK